MKKKTIYKGLLNKSISCMLSAIEIYNKPSFAYREESFAILAINAWELLLKAYILRMNKYDLINIFELDPNSRTKKTKKAQLNRCGNPKSISISKAIDKLKQEKQLSKNLEENIYSLMELRDNATHFIAPQMTKQIQELGFACVKNYITIIKKWNLEIDFRKYNFYLMPLAYVDSHVEAVSILTSETKNYFDFIQSKIKNKDETDEDFDIAISIDINLKKGNSFDSLNVKYDENGLPIMVSEENIRKKYPLTFKDITAKCRERYSNFCQNKDFNNIMAQIKKDKNSHHERKLDPNNKKSQKQSFYSTNIWKELDQHYSIKIYNKQTSQSNLFDESNNIYSSKNNKTST